MDAYFAYGANLAEAVMAQHCPGHVFIGVGELPGYRFAFMRRSVRTGTGVADVVPDPESSVWGVLYDVDDFAALDAKEGAGWAYDRCAVSVRVGDETVPAVTYVVRQPEPAEVPPGEAYIGGILTAARDRGLPPSYIEKLSEHAAAVASSSAPRP